MLPPAGASRTAGGGKKLANKSSGIGLKTWGTGGVPSGGKGYRQKKNQNKKARLRFETAQGKVKREKENSLVPTEWVTLPCRERGKIQGGETKEKKKKAQLTSTEGLAPETKVSTLRANEGG